MIFNGCVEDLQDVPLANLMDETAQVRNMSLSKSTEAFPSLLNDLQNILMGELSCIMVFDTAQRAL